MLAKKFFKTKDEVEVTFSFVAGKSVQVALLGDFNDWQPQAMKFNAKEQCFKLKLRLPKNHEYQFRYRLDNTHWENDHVADAYVPNKYGSENSLVSTYAND